MNYTVDWIMQNAFETPAPKPQMIGGGEVKFKHCKISGKRVPDLFVTSDKPQPCTKGADGVFIHLPAGAFGQPKESVVLVIDCEGSGAEAAGQDTRIVLPALLLTARGSIVFA